MDYSKRVHRQRDEALDQAWRGEHNKGECGGTEGFCYICCKHAVLEDVKKVIHDT